MLKSVSSTELTEWMAYEKYAGPIGQIYSDEVLRQILDGIRWQSYLIGGQYKENPVPKPSKAFPTPTEFANMKPVQDEFIEVWEED